MKLRTIDRYPDTLQVSILALVTAFVERQSRRFHRQGGKFIFQGTEFAHGYQSSQSCRVNINWFVRLLFSVIEPVAFIDSASQYDGSSLDLKQRSCPVSHLRYETANHCVLVARRCQCMWWKSLREIHFLSRSTSWRFRKRPILTSIFSSYLRAFLFISAVLVEV